MNNNVKLWKDMTLGLLAILIASFSLHNGNRNLSIFRPDLLVFIIFGFIHSYNIWKIRDEAGIEQPTFALIPYTLLYTSWYIVVLFPYSALATFEWILMLFILAPSINNFIGSKKTNAVINIDNPFDLILPGICLLLIKIITFFYFGNKIWNTIKTNAPLFSKILIILGLIIMVIRLFKFLGTNFAITESKRNSIMHTSGKLIRNFVNMLAGLISLKALIIIGVILSLVSILTVANILSEITSLVSNALETATSTGQNLIIPSMTYWFCQGCVLVYVMYKSINLQSDIKKDLKQKIASQIKVIAPDLPDNVVSELQNELCKGNLHQMLLASSDRAYIRNAISNYKEEVYALD